jgi:hypothetical protein
MVSISNKLACWTRIITVFFQNNSITMWIYVNPLKTSGYFMYHLLLHTKLWILLTVICLFDINSIDGLAFVAEK